MSSLASQYITLGFDKAIFDFSKTSLEVFPTFAFGVIVVAKGEVTRILNKKETITHFSQKFALVPYKQSNMEIRYVIADELLELGKVRAGKLKRVQTKPPKDAGAKISLKPKKSERSKGSDAQGTGFSYARAAAAPGVPVINKANEATQETIRNVQQNSQKNDKTPKLKAKRIPAGITEDAIMMAFKQQFDASVSVRKLGQSVALITVGHTDVVEGILNRPPKERCLLIEFDEKEYAIELWPDQPKKK